MLQCTISENKDIEPVVYEWGAVKWVANRDLDPGCEQSFGLVHILPGKDQSRALAHGSGGSCTCSKGECDVRLGDRHLKMGPGRPYTSRRASSTRSQTTAGSRSSMSVRSRPACAARYSKILRRRVYDHCPAKAGNPLLVEPSSGWARNTT